MSLRLKRLGPDRFRLQSDHASVSGNVIVISQYWKSHGGQVSEIIKAIRDLKVSGNSTAYFGGRGLYLYVSDGKVSA